MKNIIILSTIILITACGSRHGDHQTTPEAAAVENTKPSIETSDEFRGDLTLLLDGYFLLKDALVATNQEDAARHATALQQQVQNFDPAGLSEEALAFWTSEKGHIESSTGLISTERDVEEQRLHFETLSNSFITLIETFGPLEKVIYRQTCPMVRGGSADWLSASDQVFNPYHGSRMLRCGSVVSRL